MGKPSETTSVAGIALRVFPVCWVLAAAWPYGGATWTAQFWLHLVALPILIYTITLPLLSRQKVGFSIQATSFMAIFVSMAAFAAIQTIQWNPDSTIASKLSSTQLQSKYLTPESSPQIPDKKPLDENKRFTKSRISISTDRGHSFAAIPSLMAAIVSFTIGYLLVGPSPRAVLVAFALLMANSSIVAAIGIAEDIAANQWQLLGIKISTAFGPFVSRNSAAMFLNIGIACGFAVISSLPSGKPSFEADPSYRYSTRSPLAKLTCFLEDLAADISSSKLAAGASMVLIFVAILVTLSRGGIASSIAGFALVACTSFFRNRRLESLLLIGTLFLVATGLIVWLDQLEIVTSRIETVTEGDAVSSDARWIVWRFSAYAFSELWLTGGGLGNFHYTYLPFQNIPIETWFYHAESFYWQTAVDLGLPGVCAICVGILLVLNACYRLLARNISTKKSTLGPAIVFLCSTLILHNLVDFSLILPGIYLPACLAIGILFAATERDVPQRRKRKRTALSSLPKTVQTTVRKHLLFPVLLLIPVTAILAISPSFIAPRSIAEQLQTSLDNWQYDAINSEEKLDEILREGESAITRFPNDGQLNQVLGRAYTEKFRLLQYNSTTKSATSWNNTNVAITRIRFLQRIKTEQINLSTFFTSKSEADTLRRSHNHWQKASAALPLDWRPHIALAELDFVDFEHEHTFLHLEKLKSLAFNRPKVLTNAGLLALAYPGKDQAFELFKRSLESSPSQLQLIFPIAYRQFGKRIVNEPFLPLDPISLLQLTETKNSAPIHPETLDGIWDLIEVSLPQLSDDNRQKAIIAAELYRYRGNKELEIASLRQAVTMSPIDTELRVRYAEALAEDKQYRLALEQIETCLRQRPNDAELKTIKVRIEQQVLSN